MDKIEGFLEVGLSADGTEIVINHPDLNPDENGVGHIVFSPAQARNLADLLIKHAALATATIFADDISRCAVCGWPLAESQEKGCVRGNCSQRPAPARMYSAKRAGEERQSACRPAILPKQIGS